MAFMICPMCEHSQAAGSVCDVCGKTLVEAATSQPMITAIEGLEVTTYAPTALTAADRVEGLEVNQLAAGGVPLPPMLTEIELHHAAVGEVAVERLADVSEDRVADDGLRTEPPVGEVRCPNCQQVQEDGVICNTCGMRLPKLSLVGVLVDDVTSSVPEGMVRCDWCAVPGKFGQRCGECGHVIQLHKT